MKRSKLLFSLFLVLGFFEYFGPSFAWEYVYDLAITLSFSFVILKACQKRTISRAIVGFRFAFFASALIYLALMFFYLWTETPDFHAPVSDHWRNFTRGWFFCSLIVLLLNSPRVIRFLASLQHNPARFIAVVYFSVGVITAFLLTLPVSLQPGVEISLLDALFTSISALSGAGLVVTNTALTYSTMGQILLLIVIQAGGVGIVTFSGILLLFLGKELGLREKVIQDETERISFMGNLKTFSVVVASVMIFFESIGAILLFPFMLEVSESTGEAVFHSIFHSVSAFCTAGFTSLPNGAESAGGAAYPLTVIASLSLIAMLGLPTIINLIKYLKPKRGAFLRLEAYSKLELIIGASLLIFGVLSLFVLELHSPRADEIYSSWRDVLVHSFFHSSMRNAGFNSMDLAEYSAASIFVLMSLMIVGGASMSTSGGIRTSTLGVVLIFIISFLKGRPDATFAGRRISPKLFLKSISLVFIFFATLFVSYIALTLTQDIDAIPLLFETISALAICGLSLGATAELNAVGKAILIALMLIGRIGFLTAIYALLMNRKSIRYRLPQGEFYVG